VFTLDVGILLIGVILMFTMQVFRPAFFRGQTLNRDTPTCDERLGSTQAEAH